MSNITIETLISIGGNEWISGDHHRIYFNDLATLYGLEFATYNTGNISSATLNGEKISNSKARKLSTTLDFGKLWFDVTKGEFASRNLPSDIASAIIDTINNKAAH